MSLFPFSPFLRTTLDFRSSKCKIIDNVKGVEAWHEWLLLSFY